MGPAKNSSDPCLVAVIAVHGVADQQPSNTARSIAGLLQSLEGFRLYEAFQEKLVRLKVRPARPQPLPVPDEGSSFAAATVRQIEITDAEATYSTVRLEGKRGQGSGPCVHVYEMYWADLSRLDSFFLRVFTELYQLILHVPRLGCDAVDCAAQSFRGKAWGLFRHIQRSAAETIGGPVPLLNLLMAAVALAIAAIAGAAMLPSKVLGFIAAACAVLPIGLGIHVGLRNRQFPKGAWTAIPVLSVAGIAAGWYLPDFVSPLRIVALVSLLAAAGAFLLIAKAYERRRPGVFWFAVISSLLFWPAVSGILGSSGEAVPLIQACVESFRRAAVVLGLCWGAFLALGVAAHFAGWGAVHAARYSDEAQRVRWTARLTLSLPAMLFLLVTIAFWSVGSALLIRIVPSDFTYVVEGVTLNPDTLRERLLYGALVQLFALIIPVSALGALMGLWGLLPAVLAEIKPPAPDTGAAGLGEGLDNATWFMRWGGRLQYLAMIWIASAGAIVVKYWPEAVAPLAPYSYTIVGWVGSALAGTILTAVAVRGKLESVALGFRSVLDVALDVDNHLKLHPVDSNPRGRITSRFLSLLHYVDQWRGENGSPYAGVVVIAHSQGSVIAADLFRVLAMEGRPVSANRPVHFFTMGCPLRQLYSLRFPHLYRWVRKPNGPDPADLSVASWVNAYRSGDYVGRHLWWEDHDPRRFDPRATFREAQRKEFCIGAGAHTHYWESSAQPVASELDRLIRALTGVDIPPPPESASGASAS